MKHKDDIPEEYEERLDEFVSNHPDVSRADAEEAFREHCETFRETLKEDAPREKVRSLAFDKLLWDPPGDE
jgi:hypothetical protein